MEETQKKLDGRRNNRGTVGHKGGPGRPKTAAGARPRRMDSAFDDEDVLIKKFIKIVREDIERARSILE